jgi:hypothetical protein
MSRAQRRAHLQPNNEPRAKAVKAARPVAVKPTPEIIQSGPVPEVDDLDCAFPTRWRELLPKWDDLTDEEKRCRGPFCEALQRIFFSGGKLDGHGITVKAEFDSVKVHRYIRATLGDFGPSHEHKIGGIAHMLKKWCSHDGRRK